MKILHVTPAYFPATYWGGPMVSIHRLCTGISALPEFSIRVLTTDSAGPAVHQHLDVSEYPKCFNPSLEVYYCRRVFSESGSFALLAELPRMVAWSDLVHVSGVYSQPVLGALLAAAATKRKVVWSPRGAIQASHDWAEHRRPRLKRGWESLCARLAGRDRCILHLTAEPERVATLARLPGFRAKVIPNGVDIPTADPTRAWLRADNLRAIYLGRLDPKKGIANLIQAFAGEASSRMSLEVFGDGDHEYRAYLENLVRTCGLADRVKFRGPVEGDNKTRAFQNADVCVVPSHNENFCMVVAEALAHGTPVIASRGTPWSALVERGCGLWVDNSPSSLANALAKIRTMDLADMGKRGRDWMISDFGWEGISRQMAEVYRQAVGVYGDKQPSDTKDKS